MPEVSIVIPTYRRPELLAQALRSVEQQSMADVEVLVCDNAADSDTRDVVTQFNDLRFIYVPRPTNLGMFRNVMLGLAQASSPFVMKLDDDDMLLHDSLDRLIRPFADQPDLMISAGGLELVDQQAGPLPRDTRFMNHRSGRDHLREGLVSPATVAVAGGAILLTAAMVRKDVVDWVSVPEDVDTAYDLYVCLKAVEDGRPAYFTPQPVIRYRIHPGSDTQRHLRKQAQASRAVLSRAIADGRHEDEGPLRRRLAQSTVLEGRVELREGQRRAARHLLWKAMRVHPTPEILGLLLLSHLPASLTTLARNTRARTLRRAWPTVSSEADSHS